MEVGIILSIVVAVSTVIYTTINYLMLVESIRQRKQKTEPHIIAYLKSTEDHKVLALHIKNIGNGVGINVRIKTIKSYDQFKDSKQPLTDLGIFKNGLNVFPPGYELKFYLDAMQDIDYNNEHSLVEFEVACERRNGREIVYHYKLPFNQLTGQNYSEPPENYLGQIPYYLKKINSNIKLSGGNPQH